MISKNVLRFSLILTLLALSACLQSERSNADDTEGKGEMMTGVAPAGEKMSAAQIIEVVARLDEFIVEGVVDDFSDGTSVSYDVSVFRILEPQEHRQKELQVLHDYSPEEESVWKKVGHTYRIRLDVSLLSESGGVANAVSISILEKIE